MFQLVQASGSFFFVIFIVTFAIPRIFLFGALILLCDVSGNGRFFNHWHFGIKANDGMAFSKVDNFAVKDRLVVNNTVISIALTKEVRETWESII